MYTFRSKSGQNVPTFIRTSLGYTIKLIIINLSRTPMGHLHWSTDAPDSTMDCAVVLGDKRNSLIS